MKAVRIHTFGGPEVMQVEEVPTPSPQAGQVLVRLAAAGLNYIDIYQRSGLYPNPLPYTMGLEGSGMEHNFALGDTAPAHASLEGRRTTGKVLLIP